MGPSATGDGIDNTAVYRAIRQRTTALVRAAGPGAGDRRVPACPEWTVRDVTAHLTGVCDDILNGRLDGIATDPWTAAQVDSRRGMSVDEVLDEWDDAGPRAEALFGDPGVHPQMVMDAFSHEQDIRAALDQPGVRDDEAVHVAIGFLREALPEALLAAGAPALRIRCGDDEWVFGPPGEPPAATLTATAFDLMRSRSGRRTREQILGLDWGGADPTPWLPTFTWGPFTLPERPFEPADRGLISGA
jgi:uncharacterized protein (TIGR03083 family)